MNKPNFKKYTKEEAIAAAKKMIGIKKEWCEKNILDGAVKISNLRFTSF